MTAPKFVLSIFPGIGLMDRAFEECGFCVVRGPDCLWGGDVRAFHPPSDVFDGVIGGPPCQAFSPLANINRAMGNRIRFGNLIPEFERCVAEAAPRWFVMENVERAPEPQVSGYRTHTQRLNNRWLGERQHRVRDISLGSWDGRALRIAGAALEHIEHDRAVTSTNGGVRKSERAGRRSHGTPLPITRPIEEIAELQGLPRDFLADAPFTASGKRKAIANGVPLPMGRAVARAVLAAMYGETQDGAA